MKETHKVYKFMWQGNIFDWNAACLLIIVMSVIFFINLELDPNIVDANGYAFENCYFDVQNILFLWDSSLRSQKQKRFTPPPPIKKKRVFFNPGRKPE